MKFKLGYIYPFSRLPIHPCWCVCNKHYHTSYLGHKNCEKCLEKIKRSKQTIHWTVCERGERLQK